MNRFSADFRQEFIEFAVKRKVLCFGTFTTKAGRVSPYFFNAGLFNDGESMVKLSRFYAKAVLASGIPFDMLFGPAYKGIPLVTGIAMTLASEGRNLPFAYNRKEAKDHGEGGTQVGAPLKGKVLIVDDVISAGSSVRESVEIIRAAGALPAGVVIAMDRMECGRSSALSAIQEVEETYGFPVIAVANLDHLLKFLHGHTELSAHHEAVTAYRSQYGYGTPEN